MDNIMGGMKPLLQKMRNRAGFRRVLHMRANFSILKKSNMALFFVIKKFS